MSELPILAPESCDGCGLCCEGIGSPVLLYQTRPELQGPHPFRPAGLPQDLIDEIDRHFAGVPRGHEPQERCLWFDPKSRRCRHYEWRPQICHEYELGGPQCVTLRAERARELMQGR